MHSARATTEPSRVLRQRSGVPPDDVDRGAASEMVGVLSGSVMTLWRR